MAECLLAAVITNFKRKIMRYTLLLGLFLGFLLAGCGFQLRGVNTQLSDDFQQTYLIESDLYDSAFQRQLKKLLVANGANLVEKTEAKIIVNTTPIETGSRQIALANNGTLKEYERTYRTTVTVIAAGSGIQLGSRTLSTMRTLQLDDSHVIAGEEQSIITQADAERTLASAAIRYLESF